MVKNDRMRMTRVTSTLSPTLQLSLTALLLGAAALAAAQTPAAEPASAPEPAASVAAPSAVARPVAHKTAPPAAVASLNAPASWAALSASQRSLLAPLAGDWPELSASQRSKWLNATPMLATLPEPELTRLHERMSAWARLTPAERRDARVGFQVAKQVGVEERQAKWEAYQALPPEKRQQLIDKATARREAQTMVPAQVARPLVASPKSNIVPAAPKLMTPTPVTGSLILAKPGVSTVLITRAQVQPTHHVAGETKVVADPALVDAKTLLPKSLKVPSPAPAPHS
jgi:hypothetical protein